MLHPRTVERACAWGSALVPAAYAAAHLEVAPSDAADLDLLRTVGLVDGGQSEILASLVAAPFAFVPLGSGFTRASLASVAVTAVAGWLLYAFARHLVAARESRASRLSAPVCAVAALTAMLSPLWQAAATRPVGANLGALFALAVPLAVRASTRRDGEPARRVPPWLRGAALLLPTLALDTGAFVLAAAGWTVASLTRPAGTTGPALRHARPRRSLLATVAHAAREARTWGAAAMAIALLGAAVHSIDRSAMHPLPSAPLASFAPLHVVNPAPAVLASVGGVALALAAVGLALLLLAPRSRSPGLVTLCLVLVALAEMAAGSDEVARAAHLVVVALASAAMAPALYLGVELLRGSSDGRGLARALLLVLAEAAFVVSSAADAGAAMDARTPADESFAAFALERVPTGALVLVADRALYRRIGAAAVTGDSRPDVTFVPLFDLQSREGSRAWEAHPKLLPLFRDFALLGAPAESTLSALASVQPLLVESSLPPVDALTHHQVPAGVFDRFFPESRGPSDRQRALDEERLPPVDACVGPEAAALIRSALRRRAFAFASMGEREVALRAAAEAQRFSPDDPDLTRLEQLLAAPWKRGAHDDVAELLHPTLPAPPHHASTF